MLESFANIAALLAYAAVIGDFLLQIRRVWSRKHSADISIAGVSIRTLAACLLFTKLVLVGDMYLILGQAAVLLLLSLYLGLVVRYRGA